VIRRYDEADYWTIEAWARSRRVEIADQKWLPALGFINEHAVCFIVATDTKSCLIEYLIAAKSASSDNIDEVVLACVKTAQGMGYKKILALTEKDSVIARATRLGFNITQSKLLELGI